MRIALFTEVFLPKIDGITNRLRHTILQLHRLGHEVRVFAPDGAIPAFDGARFPGFLRGEKLAAAYASADVFVMPSTTETLGFVVLEAMSSGCPVVAARAGGIPDVVTHGHDGLLFDPAQPDGAAAAVRQLLAAPGVRRGFATRARKSAESCAWPEETRKLVNQYRKAIVLHQRRGTLARVWRALFS